MTTPTSPTRPAIGFAKHMRRARWRRRTEIWRYRLAIRIGGWVLADDAADLDALRGRLTDFLDDLDARCRGQFLDYHALRKTGDDTSVWIAWARWETATRIARQLHDLLEET